MRILLDECVPVGLKARLALPGHVCETVPEAGLENKKNGELLALAEGRWDVLLTTDRNIKISTKYCQARHCDLDFVCAVKSHQGSDAIVSAL